MFTVIMIIIGILFILNGITTMINSRVVENVRAQMPKGCEIYYGGSKGLLFVCSTDALISVGKNGRIAKAFCIRSAWMTKTRSKDLHLDGVNMERISDHFEGLKNPEQRACSMALRQYQKKRR